LENRDTPDSVAERDEFELSRDFENNTDRLQIARHAATVTLGILRDGRKLVLELWQ